MNSFGLKAGRRVRKFARSIETIEVTSVRVYLIDDGEVISPLVFFQFDESLSRPKEMNADVILQRRPENERPIAAWEPAGA
jgi:hypothetical protein